MAPTELGRGIVVRTGQPAPDWARILIDKAVLEEPGEAVEFLYSHWLHRRPVVVELGVSAEELKEPQADERTPYELGPEFEFTRERLHFLVWANNVDATRGEEPIWWHDRVARKLGWQGTTDGGPRDQLSQGHLHRESMSIRRNQSPPITSSSFEELTETQQEAVIHPRGPARIIAPAGSGKTRVLTQRLKYLIRSQGVEPEILTTVAYNVRAMKELRQRTADLGKRVQVRTIHSLALQILKEHRNPRVIQEPEVRGLLDPIVPWAGPILNQDRLGPYLEALTRVRLALVKPEEVEAEREDVPEFARVFRRFQSRLVERGCADYDELIYGAIGALCQNPKLRKRWQTTCQHLLVDEFQDLTPAYLLLLRLLAAPAYQVYGVGDDDQVIYGYHGADPAFLVDFEKLFPEALSYDLGINFRCPRGVVEGARSLLERNRMRLKKTIEADADSVEGGLEIARVDWTREAKGVFEKIEGWISSGVSPSQVAVLARVNSILLPIYAGLTQRNIPCACALNLQLLNRTGMRTALAYLRLAARPEEFEPGDLVEALRRPTRYLKRERIRELGRAGSVDELFKLITYYEDWEQESVEEFVGDLRLLRRALKKEGVAVAIRRLRTDVGLGSDMDTLDRSTGRLVGGGHLDDLQALEQTAHGMQELGEFEELLRGVLGQESKAGVRLSSVHRVKGQEWPKVVVIGARKGVLPHRLADELEEERRIFHVALTRSIEETVVFVDQHQPSPFVKELKPVARLVEGATVSHQVFGQGVAVKVMKKYAKVEFSDGSTRKVQMSYLEPV